MNLDVKQTDDAYIIHVEMPGVDKDNLHVEVDDSMHAITITSEVKGDTTEEGEETSEDETGERFLMRERAWGRATRTIQLPDDAEIDKAQDPQLKDGVLTLTVPKREGQAPKRKLQIK